MTMTMAGEPTVTVNTRAALGDVFEMFNTSPAKEKRGGGSGTIEEEDEGEEAVAEVCISIILVELKHANYWR